MVPVALKDRLPREHGAELGVAQRHALVAAEKNGQILVKCWSNAGQMPVKVALEDRLPREHGAELGVAQHHALVAAEKNSQILVKNRLREIS